MAKVKGFEFSTQAVKVVTPIAETLFMCIAEPNEYTEAYGGKLLFTEEQLDKEVTYTVGKSSTKMKAPFRSIIDDIIDEALKEVKTATKKGTREDKIKVHQDKEGNDTDKFEIACKNKDKPRVVDIKGNLMEDFEALIGNGSKVKAQLYLKPYTMQGKVGVTAYLNSLQIIDLIEYGNSDSMFEDESDNVADEYENEFTDASDGEDF